MSLLCWNLPAAWHQNKIQSSLFLRTTRQAPDLGPLHPRPLHAMLFPRYLHSSCSLTWFRPLFKCHLSGSSLPLMSHPWLNATLCPAPPALPDLSWLLYPLHPLLLSFFHGTDQYYFTHIFINCLFSLTKCNSLRTRILTPCKQSISKGLSLWCPQQSIWRTEWMNGLAKPCQ